MAKHYFFRFGKGNNLFKEFYSIDYENKSIVFNSKYTQFSDDLIVAIYYDDFDAKEVRDHFLNKVPSSKITKGIKGFVGQFFNTNQGDFFWIFLDDQIICLEQVSPKHELLFDKMKFHDLFNEKHKTPAKWKRVKLAGIFSRSEVPEIFATTDSSGGRGSMLDIAEKGIREENYRIADALVSHERIKINDIETAVRYLSPIQFETLFFKYFNDNDYIVTSHRGGSKFRIDIEVLESGKTIPFFDSSSRIRIQVKRTHEKKSTIQSYLDNKIYFACLSGISDKKIAENNYFIGPEKLKTLLDPNDPRATSTIRWLKAVLQNGKDNPLEFGDFFKTF